MKKNMKRLVTLLLCAVMALGLLAVSASADSQLKDVDGLETSKTVTDNGGGTYTVTLSAYATGTATDKKVYQPLDIVIAMDVSGKMNEYIDVGDREQEGLVKLLDTAYGANENVYQMDDGGDRPVSGTHYDAYRRMRHVNGTWYYRAWAWSGTAYYSDVIDGAYSRWGEYYGMEWPPLSAAFHEGKAIRTKKIDAEKIAVQNLLDDLKGKAAAAGDVPYNVSVVQYAGDNTGTNGSEHTGTSNIVCGWTTNYDSVKNTVVQQDAFADNAGKDEWNNTPNYMTSGADYLDQALLQAQSAFSGRTDAKKIVILFSSGEYSNDENAKTIKNQMGDVTIYTVAIGATNSGVLSEIANGGAYSSIYANDLKGKLDEIFKEINETTVSTIKLNGNAVLQDEVTKYFDIVDGSVEIYTETSTAKDSWTKDSGTPAGVSVSVYSDKVTATGFDYAANWSGEETHDNGKTWHSGKKLVVTFKIQPKATFLGGDGVPTNVTENCGIYSGTTLVENFPDPGTKNVPLKDLTIIPKEKNVYLKGVLTLADVQDADVYINYGNTNNQRKLNLDAKDYGLEEWQVEFVDSIAITQGNIVETSSPIGAGGVILMVDRTYSLQYTIASGSQSKKLSDTAHTANINIFTPRLTYKDETIYLGQTPTLQPTHTQWEHEKDGSTAVASSSFMIGSEPTLTREYNYDTFTDCHTDMKVEKAAINGYDVTSYVTVENSENSNIHSFAVHVLKPTLSAENVTIYRGNEVNLNDQVKIEKWECECSSKETVADGGRTAPIASYDYKVKGTENAVPDKPTDCTDVTATLKLNDTSYDAYTASFTVHVLQPSFDVTTSSVWADYGTEVDLVTDGCVTLGEVTWVDKNTSGIAGGLLDSHSGLNPDTAKKPSVKSKVYTFDDTTLTDNKYTVGESDKTFNLMKAAVTFGSGNNAYTKTVEYTDKSFTVHVNTFALTINKTWDGAACYGQDAIFTVQRRDGDDNVGTALKVVIPYDDETGKNSVTIEGLLCGQTYAVGEESSWSWRWNSSPAQFTTHTSPEHAAVTSEAVNNDQSMEFTNTLNGNTKWLSGSAYANNKYSGSWSRVDGTAAEKAKRLFGLN